jgi:UDP-N-acetylmuramate dehydrogenase
MTLPPRPAALAENVPLAPLTTLQVGGPARWFLKAPDTETVRAGLAWARAQDLPFWVLGGGSNVVIADAGLPGLVVQPCGKRRQMGQGDQEFAYVHVEAGAPWDELVAWTVSQGLGGLECLSGIPGLTGAAPVQNIGAYGQEVADVLDAIDVLDLRTGELARRPAAACGFGYRDSVFKRSPGRWLVLSVTLRLRREARPEARHTQVREAVGDLHALPAGAVGLQQVRDAVLALRRSKSMVVDPADPDSRSAGSFFQNPVVPAQLADSAATRLDDALQPGETMPRWTTPLGIKLSAAWLIERSGMPKGYGTGPVGLSQHHTLALVNRGGATAADVMAFAAHVQDRVRQATGVQLDPEPVRMGDFGAA